MPPAFLTPFISFGALSITVAVAWLVLFAGRVGAATPRAVMPRMSLILGLVVWLVAAFALGLGGVYVASANAIPTIEFGIVTPILVGTYHWPVWAFGLLAAGLVGLVVFYLWERRRAQRGLAELLPVALLENRNFALGTLMTLIFFSGIPGLFMMLAIFFQSGFGLTPLASGLATMPFPVGVLAASILAGRLGNRLLAPRVAIGSLLLAIGMVYLRLTFSMVETTIDQWLFVPPLFIAGAGLGLAVTALFQTILQGVPPRDSGSASGALQAFQQVGGALGVALVGEIFFTTLASTTSNAAQAAFVDAASNATAYEIGAFLLVALMVALLKPLPLPVGQGQASGRA